MRGWHRWLYVVGVLLVGRVCAVEVPAPLEPWRGWALHGDDASRCPVRDGGKSPPTCRWPGRLDLDASAEGLRFVQTWTLQSRTAVPLPGDAKLRPESVEVDGKAAPVVLSPNGRPWLSLDAGSHRIEGRIAWARRPASLPVPDEIALISLRVDGATLPRPQRNEDGELELGTVQVEEGDALQFEVYRLLADGVPQWLATRLYLSVSGSPREHVMPSPLPEGFVPVAIDSELPARLESDGRLRLQLRSGQFAVTVLARAPSPREQFRRTTSDAWPRQEIWQFRADPHFRVAQLTGLPGIDPNQVALPDWTGELDDELPPALFEVIDEADELPAFLFDAGAEAALEVALRGLPAQRAPRLSLQRALWLDFDGGAWRSIDRIRGELGSAPRIDMRAPWSMQRASRGGEGLLITEGVQPGQHGVELRDADVDVEIDARVDASGLRQASGWSHGFDAATAVLNLPPAYRLIAVVGADRAEGSWWESWDLLDLFLLSVIALLAWRLGGAPLGAIALCYGVLAWQQPDAPRLGVLLLLGTALLAKHVVAGRIGSFARALRGLSLALVALLGLGFAATELRLALYPQLEQSSVPPAPRHLDRYRSDGAAEIVEVQFAPGPAAPPPQPVQEMRSQKQDAAQSASSEPPLDRIMVTGSRIKAVDTFAYPADALVQSGSARPDWQWQRHTLHWNGPLLPDDLLGLVIAPPWMTRLWRVAAVALLFWLLARIARRTAPVAPRPGLASAAPAALCLAMLPLLLPFASSAQSLPDAQLLQELRARLLARDEPCRPNCGALGAASVVARPQHLLLALDAHVQAELVWPLPRPDASLALSGARVDGAPAAVRRDAAGDWLHLPRGVHRIELDYVPEGERWRIAFPLPPARLGVDAAGFEIVGIDQGRLVGDTLELIPPRRAAASPRESERSELSEAVPPFVGVQRRLTLDQQWEMEVTVERVAPLRGGINLRVPLLPGEQPFHDAPPVRDGQAVVSMPAGIDSVSWRSRLTPSDVFSLTAGSAAEYAEAWEIRTSPLLHVQADGIPEAGSEYTDAAIRRYLPLPGETLQLKVWRPTALDGARFAIENVRLRVTPGQRARDSSLTFQLRATQAGQHRIGLPPAAELLSFGIDGDDQPRVLDQGELRLPLRPGTQRVELRWREPIALGPALEGPQVALRGSTSNIALSLAVPEGRWLLHARGPQVGPAVLVWGELLVMALAALLLARIGGTSLRFHHWLLLGLGFSTLSWPAAVLVASWLLLLGWRGRRVDLVERRVFPWLQIGLAVLSVIALLALVVAVPYGLLGRPDMHVAGNASSAELLHWFADRSERGDLPPIMALSLPMWVYKLAILAWAMWLANALIGWLRWAWQCLGAGGAWRPIFRRKPAAAAASAKDPHDAAPSGIPVEQAP